MVFYSKKETVKTADEIIEGLFTGLARLIFRCGGCILLLVLVVSYFIEFPTPNATAQNVESEQEQSKYIVTNSAINSSNDRDRFFQYMEFVYADEGGYANYAADRGGKTYKGITAAIAQRYAGTSDPRQLTKDQIDDIYYKHFWQQSKCYEHPVGLDYLCLDTVILFGSGGDPTIPPSQRRSEGWTSLSHNVNFNDPVTAIDEIIKRRQAWHRRFVQLSPNQHIFLQGWTNRTERVGNNARQIARGEQQ